MELFPAAFRQELGCAGEQLPAHHWANIKWFQMPKPMANLEWSLHQYIRRSGTAQWKPMWMQGGMRLHCKITFFHGDWLVLDLRLWLYAAEKKSSFRLFSFHQQRNPCPFTRNIVFLILNPLLVDRAATDWEWIPVWRGTGAALFLLVDPVKQQPLVSNGT